MKCFLYLFTILLCSTSCKQKGTINSDEFSDSFKKLKSDGKLIEEVEHMDSINKIYSNYKYHIAFDGPNNWEFDFGVSQHTIYRTYQPDSLITFALNVIENETKMDEGSIKPWELYQENSELMNKPFIELIEYQKNTKIENFIAEKVYIKNKEFLRRSFKYFTRDLDMEYYTTHIVLQTFSDNITLTFSLSTPTFIYERRKDYFESIFGGIYLLKDTEKLNQFINNHN